MATTTTLHLETFEAFARPLIESGKYPDADAVLTAAMGALLREESDDVAKRRALVQALEEGKASGIYPGDAFEYLRREMGWESLD